MRGVLAVSSFGKSHGANYKSSQYCVYTHVDHAIADELTCRQMIVGIC